MKQAPSHPLTCEYLRSVGIDPNMVCVDNFDETGYDTFVLHSETNKKVRWLDGEPQKERHEWPSEFVARRAVEIFASEHARWMR